MWAEKEGEDWPRKGTKFTKAEPQTEVDLGPQSGGEDDAVSRGDTESVEEEALLVPFYGGEPEDTPLVPRSRGDAEDWPRKGTKFTKAEPQTEVDLGPQGGGEMMLSHAVTR